MLMHPQSIVNLMHFKRVLTAAIGGVLRGVRHLCFAPTYESGASASLSFRWYHSRERRRHFLSYAVFQSEIIHLWTVEGEELVRIIESVKYKFFSSQIDLKQYLDHVGHDLPDQSEHLHKLEKYVAQNPEHVEIAVRWMATTLDSMGSVPVVLDGAHRVSLLLRNGKKRVICRLV